MIKNTYLCCDGHYTTKGHQKLRWVVDFKNAEVKEQLREAFMNGRYEGELKLNNKTIKWFLKDFHIVNIGVPGTTVPVSFDMLTKTAKELIVDKMVGDFWLASFNISGDNLLIADKLLNDRYNCIAELQKAFNSNSDYLEDILPFIPDKFKYDKRFMKETLDVYESSRNTEECVIKNAVIMLKYDKTFVNCLSEQFMANEKFIKELEKNGIFC